MKSIILAGVLGVATAAAVAQAPNLCDSPDYAKAFNSRFDKELALRQRLGELSQQAVTANQARLRRALLESNRVSEAEFDAKLAEIAVQPDVVELTKARDAAPKDDKVLRLSFSALDIAVGPDPLRVARAQCLLSSRFLVDVARGRALSERAAALTQARLLAFGDERRAVQPEQLAPALQPATWACATPEGRAAAEEDAALQMEVLRAQQKQSESALEALLKVKGWDKQKRSQVFKGILEKAEFAAIESEKQPVVAELVALMNAGGSDAGAEPTQGACTWPARLRPTLQKIGELNARQYRLMGQAVQQAE